MAQSAERKKVWKKKKWFKIISPEMFNGKVVGETSAFDGKELLGRTVVLSMKDVTGNMRQQYIKVKFRVKDVKGDSAYTRIVGHELNSDYVRRLIRRRRSVARLVLDQVTKDGSKIRINAGVFTARHADTSQIKAIREITAKILKQDVSEKETDRVFSELIFGKICSEITKQAKQICPIKRVEIVKTDLLGTGSAA